MSLHESTFEYLKPTDAQLMLMNDTRQKFAELAGHLADFLEEGPDKTYILRKLRECAMWTNIAITRNADGSPRAE